jgi:hypothetical protein
LQVINGQETLLYFHIFLVCFKASHHTSNRLLQKLTKLSFL